MFNLFLDLRDRWRCFRGRHLWNNFAPTPRQNHVRQCNCCGLWDVNYKEI